MAEINLQDKKPAKILLREIAAKSYEEAWAAKKRGEKVGWCASNFPQEIPTTLGLKVVYPENQGAAIAAKGGGQTMCEHAEGLGYSPDICAYARISMAYMDLKECEQLNMPQPDFVLCCNNICNCMIKWYENIAKELNIPMILIDIPHHDEYVCDKDRLVYIRAQFDQAFKQLEELSGKKFSQEKFEEVMEISKRTSRAWRDATNYMKCTPSPLNGFDLFNHMAVAVCARGTIEAAEAFEQLVEEYKQNVKEGISTYKQEEKYRILFEGIACFPYLRHKLTTLKQYGVNMCATVYTDAFGVLYDNMEEMMAAYSYIPNTMTFERERDLRIQLAKDSNIDGAVIHINRSCKKWSGEMYEIERQFHDALGIPTVTFDGDQADPRSFSEAQYDTRIQGLVEVMEANKLAKQDKEVK